MQGIRVFVALRKKPGSQTVYSNWNPEDFVKRSRGWSFFPMQAEYFLGGIRNVIIGTSVLIWLLVEVVLLMTGEARHDIWIYLWLLALSFINWNQIHWGNRAKLRVAEFLRMNPEIHPSPFFYLYKKELAFGGVDFTRYQNVPTLDPLETDFRDEDRPNKASWPLVLSVADTAHLAKIVMAAVRWVGPNYAFEVSDSLGSMWGKRVLQHVRGRLEVHGIENIQELDGKFLPKKVPLFPHVHNVPSVLIPDDI